MGKDYDENVLEDASTGRVDWSVYLQQGIVIDLQIKRYRGTTNIAFEELGIDSESSSEFRSFLSSYLKPGQKSLIPPEIEGQLKSIETAARQNLKDCSFDCSAFDTQGRFVPASAYKEFKRLNQEFEQRFWTIRDEFANDYDDIVNRVCDDYKILAENLYMQSHPNAKEPSSKYVKGFVEKIREQIPPKDAIVAQFEYNTFMRRISPYLLNVIKKKNDIDEKAMKIASTTPIEKPIMKKTTTEALDAEIEADLRQSIEEQSDAMVHGFIHEIPLQLRRTAYEGCVQIIGSIDKNNGKLVGRASIKAHNLVDELARMDFYGDMHLQEKVAALAKALHSDDAVPRDVAAVKAAAISLRDWAQADMKTIEKQRIPQRQRAPKVKPKQTPASSSNDKVKISVPKNTGSRRTIKNKKG